MDSFSVDKTISIYGRVSSRRVYLRLITLLYVVLIAVLVPISRAG